MAQIVALFWDRVGQWLESRGLEAVAGDCYRLAGNRGGKHGARAMWRLGGILFAGGQLPDALAAFQKSVQDDPANVTAWCDLGAAYRQSGQFDAARRCYDEVLAIDPLGCIALTRLGEVDLAEGKPAAALEHFERALDRDPRCLDAIVNRIVALTECNRIDEAEIATEQAIQHYPDNAACHINRGILFERSGNPHSALLAYRMALEIEPDNQEAQFNQAILQGDANILQNSVEYLQHQIELKGESVHRLVLLAGALKKAGALSDAEGIGRRMIESYPRDPASWKLLTDCTQAKGDADDALAYARKALELAPEWVQLCSAIAFCSNYLPTQTANSIFSAHLDWAARFEAPLLEKRVQHPPGDAGKARLRIGYVSGDLYTHPVGLLLRGVLQQHNHRRFEIHCFSTREHDASDYVTRILRSCCDTWHEVRLLSDEDLADLIRRSEIDILVDLSGHTTHNRLQIFALKPAPVQVTWLGYFHSSGLSSIDYFISDPYTTPQPAEQLFSEALVRLPHSRFCFTPFDYAPEVSEPPFHRNGYVTFGSFNRLAKLTEPVIDAWARIVQQVPSAKLLIKDWGLGDEETARHLTRKFEARGISPERLVLRPGCNYLPMLEEYAEIDIALDPFPFNGGMTTLDALWMGVPVVALAGSLVVARQSASMLSNLGLDDLVFADIETYVAGAVALASDPARLADLRRLIRPRMSRSPLCDAEQFTQNLETLYQRMWQAWCRGEKLGPEIVSGVPVARRITGSMGCSRTDSDHLVELFQNRWRDDSPSKISPGMRSDNLTAVQEKIEIISATRLSESEFWSKSALGISLRRLTRDTRLVANIAYENRRGLPEVYNECINSSDSQEILVFIHDDVWIDDVFLVDHVSAGLKAFDVIGVAGNRRRVPNQPGWAFIDNERTWDIPDNLSGCVAHNKHPFGAVSVYGAVPAECELLDGVFLAVKKSRLKAANVQFDPRFDFHFYDMDFCRSARTNGLRLGTWPICLTHQSGGMFGNPQWIETYRLYQEKWGA